MKLPCAERVTDVLLQNQWPAVSCAAVAKGPDDPATVASESTYLSTRRVGICADPKWMSSADGACRPQASAMVGIEERSLTEHLAASSDRDDRLVGRSTPRGGMFYSLLLSALGVAAAASEYTYFATITGSWHRMPIGAPRPDRRPWRPSVPRFAITPGGSRLRSLRHSDRLFAQSVAGIAACLSVDRIPDTSAGCEGWGDTRSSCGETPVPIIAATASSIVSSQTNRRRSRALCGISSRSRRLRPGSRTVSMPVSRSI
jgi:hypothetical protein